MRIDLKLGGEIIPLYFGMVAFEEMQKLVGNYMGENKYAADVVWSGYLNNCAINNEYPERKYSDVMELVESYFFENKSEDSNLDDVLSSFEKSKAGSKLFDIVDKAVEVMNSVNEAVEDSKKKKKQD